MAKIPYVTEPAPGSSIQDTIAVPYSVVATAVEDVYEEARRGSPVVVPRRRRSVSLRAVVPVSLTKETWPIIR